MNTYDLQNAAFHNGPFGFESPENAAFVKGALWAFEFATEALLVRDVAAMLGAEVPAVCIALTTLGFPPRSVNMAVTPAEAVAIARLKALHDAAQAAAPEDSYQDEWFRAKADAVRRILALPGA